MIADAFRSQWTKLRRPQLLAVTYPALFAIAAFFTMVVFLRAGRGRNLFISFAQLAQPDGLARGLDHAAPLFGLVAFGIAAAQIAMEFSLGTLRQVLVRQPRRSVLLTGEALAILTFLFGAVLVASIAGGATALVMAHVRGIPTAAWTSSTGIADLGRAFLNLALASAGYGILGILAGLLLRSPAPAVVIGFIYLVPFELAFSSLVSGSTRWLPGQLLTVISQGGAGSTVPYHTALMTSAIYMATAAVLCGVLFARRDVTA